MVLYVVVELSGVLFVMKVGSGCVVLCLSYVFV